MKSNLKLKDLTLKIGSGATPRGGKDTYLTEGSISLIRSQNIYNHSFTINGLAFISEEQAQKLNNVTLQENDVLLNLTGDSVARCCIVPKHLLPARVNQHVAIIRCDSQKLDAHYLLAVLTSPMMQQYLLSIAQTGGTRAALTKGMIENLDIPYVSIYNQKFIGNVLNMINSKIEINQSIISNFEQLAQTLFKRWFIDFEFPNKNGEPYQSSGGKMEESELGLIPEGWEIKSLLDIMDYQGGSQPPAKEFIDSYKEGYVRLVQIRDYDTDKHLTFIPDTHKLKKCSKKDIMIARYGAALGRILFGLNGAYNVALAKVLPHSIHYQEYIRCYLNTKEFYEKINNMGGRSAQSGFNKNDIKSFQFSFPKDEEIVKLFNDFGSLITELILEKREEINKLESIREAILPKLISGEIEIPLESGELEHVQL
ncbi:restriction endonuclease subunit S [Bacillus sp. RHFB]|nr:restriction endonuclease subunit S [Bacillus sp. RHFB]